MIDFASDTEALISSRPIRPTPVAQLVTGVKRRKRRRLTIRGGLLGLIALLGGVLYLDATQPAPTEVAVGSNDNADLAEGFQWFEGDEFAVQIPGDWTIAPPPETVGHHYMWTAWPSDEAPEVGARGRSPSAFSVTARGTISDFGWESFERWLEYEGPFGRGAWKNNNDGERFVKTAEVPGAIRSVRVEQELALSEATVDGVIDIQMETAIAIAAWRPDGHVVTLWITISEDSPADEELIETILGSFTLRPVS